MYWASKFFGHGMRGRRISKLFLDSFVRNMKAILLHIGNKVLRFPLLIQVFDFLEIPNGSFFIVVQCFTFSSFPHMFCNNCEARTIYPDHRISFQISMVTFFHKESGTWVPNRWRIKHPLKITPSCPGISLPKVKTFIFAEHRFWQPNLDLV